MHELPQAGRAARGKAIVNLLSLRENEKVSAFLPVREFEHGRYVLFATKDGTVKKTALDEYANPRPSGIIAIKLNEGDELIGVRLTDGDQEVILSTAAGQAIRFRESDVRTMGRNAAGVRGITLDESDAVVGGRRGDAGHDAARGRREGLRQAHDARGVPPDQPRRQRHHHHERHRQGRSRGGRPHGPRGRAT